MKKILVFPILWLFLCTWIAANPITESQALQIATTFRNGSATTRTGQNTVFTLVYTGNSQTSSHVAMRGSSLSTTINEIAEPTFYVFNCGVNQGFVIVSGDDRLSPIIAYSDQGTFIADGNIPEHIITWMNNFSRYVEGVRSGEIPVEKLARVTTRAAVTVPSLMKTTWSQGTPYSNMCPTLPNGNRCVTGCTATAIAQIMKYHNWPDSGTGSNTHTSQGQTFSINFAESHYDWNNMRNSYGSSYTTAEANAVAKLMLDIGVAVWMGYGESSGAQNTDIYGALYRNFKYSKKARFIMRNSYSTAEWTDLIKTELQAARPIYYGGYNADGTLGHAFVCDGIDANDFLHINWGWGGSCDGYFHLNFMDPSNPGIGGGDGYYNTSQTAIIGIQPATEDESDIVKQAVLTVRSYYRTSTKQTILGKAFSTNISDIWSQGPGQCSFKVATGLFRNGKFMQTVSDSQSITLAMWGVTGGITLNTTLPETLADGDYELRVVTSVDSKTWEEVSYTYYCYQRSITLQVKESNVIVTSPTRSGVEMTITAAEGVSATDNLPGKSYTANFTLTNTGYNHFNGNIGYELIRLPFSPNYDFNTSEPETDTVMISTNTFSYFIYSAGGKELSFNYSLPSPGDYRIRLYFTDPLSKQNIRFAEYPLHVDEPKAVYPRMVVIEQGVSTTAGASPAGYVAIDEMSKRYPNTFIGINIHNGGTDPMKNANYANNLEFSTYPMARINRGMDTIGVSTASFDSYYHQALQTAPVASMNIDAQFITTGNAMMQINLTSTFAYTVNDAKYRFSIITVERNVSHTLATYNQVNDYAGSRKEMGGYEKLPATIPAKDMVYDWVGRVIYPSNSFNGAEGSLPEKVTAGDTYSWSYKCVLSGFRNRSNAILVGLLIDASTGEICNAAALPCSEIYPLEGDAKPSSVNFALEQATMNTGVSAQVEATLLPLIAPRRLTWSSSNTAIATVSADGIVTALAPGTVDIYTCATDSAELADTLHLTVQQADYTQPQQVVAGYLHYLVPQNETKQPSSLILAGELNGTDILMLRLMAGSSKDWDSYNEHKTGALKKLDLSQATIIEGGEPYFCDYITENNKISKQMFYGCTALTSLIIPSSAIAIGNNAFQNCTALTSFTVPSKIRTIGYAPFVGCTALKEIHVDGGVYFREIDGALYNYYRTELVAYPAARSTDGIELYVATKTTRPLSFIDCKNLKRVVTLRTFTSAGYASFMGCTALTDVVLASKTETIEEYAFCDCSALETIHCNATTPPACSENSFFNVPVNSCILYVPANSIDDYRNAEGWKEFTNIRDIATSSVETLPNTGEDNNTTTINSPAPGLISVYCSSEGLPIAIYAIDGTLAAREETNGTLTTISIPAPGIYIVRLPGYRTKVVVR